MSLILDKNVEKLVVVVQPNHVDKKQTEILQKEIEYNLDIKLPYNLGEKPFFHLVEEEFNQYFKTVYCVPSDLPVEIEKQIVCLPCVLYFKFGELYHYSHGGDTIYETHREMYSEFHLNILEKCDFSDLID